MDLTKISEELAISFLSSGLIFLACISLQAKVKRRDIVKTINIGETLDNAITAIDVSPSGNKTPGGNPNIPHWPPPNRDSQGNEEDLENKDDQATEDNQGSGSQIPHETPPD